MALALAAVMSLAMQLFGLWPALAMALKAVVALAMGLAMVLDVP